LSPSRGQDSDERGFIIPIGGAEEKLHDSEILKRFVRLCGRDRARIAVIPTASEVRDTGASYEGVFEKLGARSVRVVSIESRREANDEEWLEALQDAHGIFLTGGNQLRLSTLLGGTPVAKLVRRLNAAGVHVAGTSAGAAFLCEHMIAHGEEGPTPRPEIVTLAPGLGLTNRVIVDQHFRQRDRLGRLLAALAFNPFAVGIGLDEDTAAFLGPDNTIEVRGSGAITVVDPSDVEFSSMDSVKPGQPVSIIGVRLHVLVEGAVFDLESRRAAPVRASSGR
jgi:cyanophycinase